jgi:hypothetical protein
MLVAVVALTAAASRLLGTLEPAKDDIRGAAPSGFVDCDGKPLREGYVPLSPTSALSAATRHYRLVSKDGGPVTVTFGCRYFADVMVARDAGRVDLPAEVIREKGATQVASGTLVDVYGFDRDNPRLVLVELLAPDLSGRRITWGVCVARQDLAPL